MRRTLVVTVLLLAGCSEAPAHEAHTAAVDATRLPLGDGKVTTSGARRGYVFRCRTGGGPPPGGGGPPGADVQGPWFNGDGTWNQLEKASVDGARTWAEAVFSVRTSGSSRVLSG